jgi:hypothetical protein
MDLEEVRPELNIVHRATAELRSSAKFKQVLQVGCAIHSHINRFFESTVREGRAGGR